MVAAVVEGSALRAPRLPAKERRAQILDAALGVFARNGYANTGTADIAAAAGIGEPTIYRYFASKHDLYLAALEHSSQQIQDNWERIAREEPDAVNALLRIGQWYHQTLRDRPDYLQLRFRSITETHDAEVLAAARARYLQLMRLAEGLMERAREQGRLSAAVDAKAVTWLFMAVGAVLDVTHLLGLQDELGPRELVGLGRVVLAGGSPP